MKPIKLKYKLPADKDDVDKCVGNMPEIVQGWRPISATIQPISAAIHGTGIEYSDKRSNHVCFSQLRLIMK